MKYFIIFFFVFITQSYASDLDDILKNLQTTDSIKFQFKQTISDNIEQGSCVIQYPEKMRCIYEGDEGKEVLVNNNTLYIIKHKFEVAYPYYIKNSIFSILLNKDQIIENINNIKKVETKSGLIFLEILTEDQKYAKIIFDQKNKIIKGWETISLNQEKVVFEIINPIINLIITEKFNIPSYRNY